MLGRLLLALPMLLIVATATFFLVQLVPGDPGSFILGSGASGEQVAELNASLGLDRPVLDQFQTWLGAAARGDLGTSWINRAPVVETLAAALPVTLSLTGLAIVVIVVAGVGLGTWAALRPGWLDRLLQGTAGLAIAVPNFWLGVGLLLLFAVHLSLFPASGYVPLSSPGEWLRSLTLPVLTLAVGPAFALALQVRRAMIDVLAKDYIRSLRAAGLPRRSVLFKHALRNCMAPVVTVIGFQVLGLIAGAVLIEQLFNLPGLGGVMLTSVTQHDVPVVQGAVLLFAVFVVLINLLIDVGAALLNPRARERA
ncbi:ABC transporter permease [Actinomadura barringtoniae]|uniref:ABC transporter permease n=1 Tax=Actinomadura barringtoniae TaxID=1427535 RepID=A0A939TA52_9ACTN|nr:ABC transporter permease [Actinomadura barringtoniae]MBO2448690.1 ABC transporter permease [Actinomadura barringtoniae]